jgi:hypothetical protein
MIDVVIMIAIDIDISRWKLRAGSACAHAHAHVNCKTGSFQIVLEAFTLPHWQHYEYLHAYLHARARS